MVEEANEALEQIESEIKETQRKAGAEGDFEIEIVEPEEEAPKEEKAEEPEEEKPEYGEKVQKRIKKLVNQRREAEINARRQQEENDQLRARIERLEKGTAQTAQNQANNAFQQRYQETRQALEKAVEEGDTQAQLNFTEQLADMRAAVRVAEMQRQQPRPVQQPQRQEASEPTPKLAMRWWQENKWFNSPGFERETAAARSIDVQLDLEGVDKDDPEYYSTLNSRLHKMFPELNSSDDEPVVKQKPKSRSPVAPTAGGSPVYKGNRVKLSNDQLRMARELGITDESALKKYEAEIKNQQSRS